MKKLPSFLRQYFWEVDFNKLDRDKSWEYVIHRLLEHGNDRAVKWMFENYKKKRMQYVLCKYRSFSEKSAIFWALVLRVPRDKIVCLQKPFLEMRKRTWPY